MFLQGSLVLENCILVLDMLLMEVSSARSATSLIKFASFIKYAISLIKFTSCTRLRLDDLVCSWMANVSFVVIYSASISYPLPYV